MSSVLEKLKGGDRRSIGRVDEVVVQVLESPELFDELFYGLFSDDPVVRMRAADALEKITRERPQYLAGYKKLLLEKVAPIEQQEVRWHFAQMAPRLRLVGVEREQVVSILCGYLDDRSKIVQVFALQAMVDISRDDPDLRKRVRDILEERVRNGSPAVQKRGKVLLKSIQGDI